MAVEGKINLTLQLEDEERGRVRKLIFFKISFKSLDVTQKVHYTSSLGFSYNKVSLQSISYWLYPVVFLVTICPLNSEKCIRYFALYTTGHTAKVLLLLYWIFLFHSTDPHSRTFFQRKKFNVCTSETFYRVQYSTCEITS